MQISEKCRGLSQIVDLHRKAEVDRLNCGNAGLKVILALAGYPHLFIHDLSRDLHFLVLDHGGNLLRIITRESSLQLHGLAHRFATQKFNFLLVESQNADTALDHLALDDLHGGIDEMLAISADDEALFIAVKFNLTVRPT